MSRGIAVFDWVATFVFAWIVYAIFVKKYIKNKLLFYFTLVPLTFVSIHWLFNQKTFLNKQLFYDADQGHARFNPYQIVFVLFVMAPLVFVANRR